MYRLVQPSFLLLAHATDRQLAHMVEYLRRTGFSGTSSPSGSPSPRERQRLLKLGRPLGSAIKELMTIVSPRTFAHWLRGEAPGPKKAKPARPGRPRTEAEVRELVLRLARENAWGYTRILGELRKLGVCSIARSTVVNILNEHGLDPGPMRGEGTRDEFLRRHAQTLAQQARTMAIRFADESVRPRFSLRDHHTKFVEEFDAILESEGIEVKPVGPVARAVQRGVVGGVVHALCYGASKAMHARRLVLVDADVVQAHGTDFVCSHWLFEGLLNIVENRTRRYITGTDVTAAQAHALADAIAAVPVTPALAVALAIHGDQTGQGVQGVVPVPGTR